MTTFILAFCILLLVVAGMAIGAMLMGKTIKGSCGGLNAVAGADKCLVCKKPVDPNSPLHERLACPRASEKQKAAARAAAEALEKPEAA